ncbi:MAG: nitroreductase [Acholeplasmataceae bacterium]|nr:nitroreductase [Acholeplasmataceae bacterium]
MKLNEIIKNRVSVKKYLDEKVDISLLTELLDVAVYAPNHKMREPWRFILIDQERKNELKQNWINQSGTIDPQDEKKFDNVFSAPMVIAFIMKLNQNYNDEIEDLQAVAALIQNFMLLAYEQGLGTAIKTPGFIELDGFKEALGIQTDEIIADLVMVGKPEIVPNPKPRIPAKEKISMY